MSTIGFDTDSDDSPQGVLDGKHSGDDSFEREVTQFLRLATTLREMGAVKVRAGSIRAEWPAAEPTQRPAVVTVPIGPQPVKRQGPSDEELKLHPDEVLTSEDRARRLRQWEIRQAVAGS
jgi:hypothetical protein